MTMKPTEAANTAFQMVSDYFAELYEGDTPPEAWDELRKLSNPIGSTVWPYQDKMDSIDYDAMTQFICDETGDSCNEGEAVAEQLVKLFDRSSLAERDAIDSTTIAITGWTVRSLVEKSQGEEYTAEIKERF